MWDLRPGKSKKSMMSFSLGNLTEVKSILLWISDVVIYYRCVCVCCHLSLGIGLVNVLGSKGGQCLQDVVAIDLR